MATAQATATGLVEPQITTPATLKLPAQFGKEQQSINADIQSTASDLTQLGEQAQGLKTPELPAAPELQSVGKPPKFSDDLHNDTTTFALMSLAMAAISGGDPKMALAEATHFLGGAIHELNEGNQQKFKDNMASWEAKLHQAQVHNQQAIERYNVILKSKTLPFEEKMKLLSEQALLDHNKLAFDTLMSGNLQKTMEIWQNGELGYDRLLMAAEGLKVKLYQTQMQYGQMFTPPELDALASNYEQTGKMPNLGWGPQRLIAMREIMGRVVRDGARRGMNPTDIGKWIARNSIKYEGTRGAVDTLTKLKETSTAYAGMLKFNADRAYEYLAKLNVSNRTPLLNDVITKMDYYLGNPHVNPTKFYLATAAMEAARLQGGAQASAGQLHQGAIDIMKEWIKGVPTPSQWKSLTNAMEADAEQRVRAFSSALDETLNMASGTHTVVQAPPAALEYLKQHPYTLAQFEAKYGYNPNGQ